MMEHLIEKAKTGLKALQEGGAEQAVCTVSREEVREINAAMGEFSLYRTLYKDSADFTAIREQRRGTLTQNLVTDEALMEGARRCLEGAAAADPDEAWQLAPALPPQSFEEGPLVCDEEKLLDRSREFLEEIAREFPLIMIEEMYVSHQMEESCDLYSTGSRFLSRRGSYSLSLMFNAQEGGKTSSFYGSGISFTSLDRPFMDLGSIRHDLALISGQVHTESPGSQFTGTMVMTPSCLAEILQTYLEVFLDDLVILDGTSIWRDKLGQRVADPRFSLHLAPLHPQMVGGERFTAEGFLSEDETVIEKGILKAFDLSDYGARKTGLSRARNSSSGNFVIPGGDLSYQEMIGGIDRGILVGRFSGGEPASSGDFSGVAKNACLIEDGKITRALSETMVSGNLADLLMNIRSISKEQVGDGYSLLPWIAFDGVLISGQ